MWEVGIEGEGKREVERFRECGIKREGGREGEVQRAGGPAETLLLQYILESAPA